VQQQSAAAKTPPADRKRPLQPSQAAERPSTTPPPLATDQKAGGGVSASAPRSTAIAILLRLSLPKTLAVIRHGVCRDNRGRNGQRWLVTGGGRARDAVRSRAAATTRSTRRWGGGCRAGHDLMAACHGVRMGMGVLQCERLVQGPSAGPVRDFAEPYEPAGA
jgi:hypothetical protein